MGIVTPTRRCFAELLDWSTERFYKHRPKDGKITGGYLNSLWEQQGGNCVVSSVPMLPRQDPSWKPKRNDAHIDLRDPKNGLVKGNVRLVILPVLLVRYFYRHHGIVTPEIPVDYRSQFPIGAKILEELFDRLRNKSEFKHAPSLAVWSQTGKVEIRFLYETPEELYRKRPAPCSLPSSYAATVVISDGYMEVWQYNLPWRHACHYTHTPNSNVYRFDFAMPHDFIGLSVERLWESYQCAFRQEMTK